MCACACLRACIYVWIRNYITPATTLQFTFTFFFILNMYLLFRVIQCRCKGTWYKMYIYWACFALRYTYSVVTITLKSLMHTCNLWEPASMNKFTCKVLTWQNMAERAYLQEYLLVKLPHHPTHTLYVKIYASYTSVL